MNVVGAYNTVALMGLHRDPEEGVIDILLTPPPASTATMGVMATEHLTGAEISVNGGDYQRPRPPLFRWPLSGEEQRITLRYNGGDPGSIPDATEVLVWIE